eukprot:RCo024940
MQLIRSWLYRYGEHGELVFFGEASTFPFFAARTAFVDIRDVLRMYEINSDESEEPLRWVVSMSTVVRQFARGEEEAALAALSEMVTPRGPLTGLAASRLVPRLLRVLLLRQHRSQLVLPPLSPEEDF